MGFLILLLLFAAASCLIDADSLKDLSKDFGRFLLNTILCAYVLLLVSFCFASSVSEEAVGSLLSFRLDTIREICLLFLWLLLCAGTSLGFLVILRIQRCRGQGSISFHFSRRQSRVLRLTLTLLVLGFLGSFSGKLYAESRIRINEVCAENDSFVYDANLKAGDYVELYNPTSIPVNLSELYLSDDLSGQMKSLSGSRIPAKGYCLIWVSKGDNQFGINPGGDSLFLTNSQKKVIDSVTVPALKKGQVYARDPLTSQWQLRSPSPLKENDPNIARIAAPEFSAESGFYQGEFSLSLSAREGYNIYYTLDSSTPEETDLLYTGPITVKNVSHQPDVYRAVQNVTKDWAAAPSPDPEGTVDKAFVVRAVAIDEYGNRSDVITKSYFVDMPQYQNGYVLSLVTDPEGLFGENGIYVTGKEYDAWYLGSQQGSEPLPNFEKRGKPYEVETRVELFHNDLLMSQNAGMRIQGGTWRAIPLKRFMLYARKIYSGTQSFSFDLFENPVDSFFMRIDFEDAFLQSLVSQCGIGGLDAVPATVFLDGEYWYTTYLRERYTENYLAQKYQVHEDSVTISSVVPQEIYDFLNTHDLGTDADYQAFNEIVDIQNYITYLSANLYLCNMDTYFDHNVRLWKSVENRSSSYGDGRWRYLIYDIDCISWYDDFEEGSGAYSVNSFTAPMGYYQYTYQDSPLYSALKQNHQFRQAFTLTFMDLANTCFEKNQVAALLEQWGEDPSRNDGFFEKRFDYIVPAMAQEMNLQGTLETITLACDTPLAGELNINTVTPKLENGTWKGQYYSDFPVTITAQANEGYEFVAWRHGEETYPDNTLSVSLTSGDNLWTAEFKQIGE